MADRELSELIDDYLFCELSPQRLAELESSLLKSSEARNLFWDKVRWHAKVREFCERQRLVKIPKEAAEPTLAGEQSTEPPSDSRPPAIILPADPDPRVKSPVLGFLGGVVDYVNHSRRLMFLLVFIALSGWFVFQVGSILIGRWFAGNAQVANQGDDGPGAVPGKTPEIGGATAAHGKALAWLSGAVNGRWQVVAGGKPRVDNPSNPLFLPNGTEFVAAQELNLVSGLAEITFQSGAKVVLTAPARLSVSTPLGANLQVGKLAAKVPHSAIGFTVNTPAGSVVDLGTEFGVEVTPDRRLNVQVFVGQVKVNSTAAGGGDQPAGEGVHVAAGHTLHVEPGISPAVVESKENKFHRDLELQSDSGDKALAAYLEFVRQLKPVVWFRMEGKDSDRVLHDEMSNADAKLSWDGPGSPFVKGSIGKSLWLRGPQLKDCAVVPNYPKAEHGKLSVVAWVYADSRPAFAPIVTNWEDRPGHYRPGQFVLQLDGDAGGHSTDLSAGITRPDGSMSGVSEGPTHLFPLNEWQHVAFTMDGSTLRLYRQGREVASNKVAGLIQPSPVRALGIGARTGNTDEPARFYWDGNLDEVAVFNEALTAEDIRKLAGAPPR